MIMYTKIKKWFSINTYFIKHLFVSHYGQFIGIKWKDNSTIFRSWKVIHVNIWIQLHIRSQWTREHHTFLKFTSVWKVNNVLTEMKLGLESPLYLNTTAAQNVGTKERNRGKLQGITVQGRKYCTDGNSHSLRPFS